MENYMDDSYIITGNTLIFYSGKQKTVKVPAHFADIELLKVGDGSFMNSSEPQCIILPPTTKEIGFKAFFNCSSFASFFLPGSVCKIGAQALTNCNRLGDVTVYGLKLSASEYYNLKETSNKAEDNVYVVRKIPQYPLINDIISSIADAKPALNIPDSIDALFHLTELDEQKGKFSLTKNIPVINFTRLSLPTDENTAFLDHIKSTDTEYSNEKSEQENDKYVRLSGTPTKDKTVIFTFDDSKTKQENGIYSIDVTLKIGYFFWQSAQSVVLNNKKYYVYRRHYLCTKKESEYIRRDIAVYTDKGIVNNRSEAIDVYAKYKLLSIL